MAPVKRVAVIGAGPAGAITVDALAQEKAFDVIRVFERREEVGGCWVQDPPNRVPQLPDLAGLAARTADKPHPVPATLPAYTPRSMQYRYAETAMHAQLETNVDSATMEFTQEPIPGGKTERSVRKFGADTPFRPRGVIREYVEGLLSRNGYADLVQCGVTVERVEKIGASWKVTLRRAGAALDYWWAEEFDAVAVASGHYSVPYVPAIEGLEKFARAYPGSVEHSKSYRGPDRYRGKNVVVVGASVSAIDIGRDLTDYAAHPVHASVRGNWNAALGKAPFEHPSIATHPAIRRLEVDAASGRRTVIFADNSRLDGVDHLILGTGFSWSLPFLPSTRLRQNRVPGLYLHIFSRHDPTLAFIGTTRAGFTFKVYEYQAVLAARVLAGRAALPSAAEQEEWEAQRLAAKGDGDAFLVLNPDFEAYFEELRKRAGEPPPGGPGRRLPRFEKEWVDVFQRGIGRRAEAVQRENETARAEKEKACVRARL